jgi:hypothetical protein
MEMVGAYLAIIAREDYGEVKRWLVYVVAVLSPGHQAHRSQQDCQKQFLHVSSVTNQLTNIRKIRQNRKPIMIFIEKIAKNTNLV